MSDQYYHAIFVDTGLTSLTAAAALAKKGKRVLLLDTENQAESAIHRAGFDFSIGPLLYLGFEKWGAMEGYFSQLAYPIPGLQGKGFSFQKVTPLLQIVLPRNRLSFFSDEEPYFDELKREFPSQAQKLKTLFDQIAREAAYFYPALAQFPQLEVEGMAERINQWKKQLDISQAILHQQKKKALEMIEALAFKPTVLAYFKLLFLFAFKKPMDAVSAFEMIRFFSGLQRGGVRMRGGYATPKNFFRGLIQSWGGVILEKATISKYETERKRVTHINLSDGTVLKAQHFIVARPSAGKSLNFYFTIPAQLIPSPMKPALLMTWGEQPPEQAEDFLALRLNEPDKADPATTLKNRLICVSTQLREGIVLSKADRERLCEKVRERLHWLIPFSNLKIKTVDGLQNLEQAGEEEALPPGAAKGTEKEVMKGILSYLQPKGLKNIYMIDSDKSDYLAQGSVFLAGHRLAQFIETAK